MIKTPTPVRFSCSSCSWEQVVSLEHAGHLHSPTRHRVLADMHLPIPLSLPPSQLTFKVQAERR